ncbi:MAG: efflux transporter outer membrane subunit [Verrucomicrobiaceae bacterium]|nr:efflux transporter outer membrane subunit [Verrucomicrobiaceae bacterium]
MTHKVGRKLWMMGVPLVVGGCIGMAPLGSKRMKSDVEGVQKQAPDAWSAAARTGPAAATGWLSDFGDGSLRGLVDRAIAGNPDLKATAARVQQARALTRQAGAAFFPTLDGAADASRSQRPGDQRFAGLGQRANRFNSTLDISWEPDFWGKIADQRGQRSAETAAAAADLHAAQLSLAANTVKTAVTLAEARAQLALAEENVRTRQIQLKVLDRQLDRGIDPDRLALDISLSRADLARAESTVTQRRQDLDETTRSLERLLGGYPAGKERGLVALPDLRRSVPAGLPSEMLLRRPDLRAAEQRLMGELRGESAAKKALLPSIRLTGDKGYSTQELASLLSASSVIWTVASQLTQPIFQGGRLKAGVELAKARYDEALQQYAGSVLTAFQEVETSLAAETFLVQQAGQLSRAVEEAERSDKLAQGQYERGLVDVLTLLDARQRAFDARRALLTVEAQRLRNRADLYLALGGSF